MNKLFLIIVTALSLTVNANCQWNNRRNGVIDLNQLSPEQLNQALARAQKGIKGGAIISLAGAAGITGGLLMTTNESEDFAKSLGGMVLTAVSVFTEVAGLAVLINSSLRSGRIKKVLNCTVLNTGLIKYQREYICSDSKSLIMPCLSITISF